MGIIELKEFAEKLAGEKKRLQRFINENNEVSLQDSQDKEDAVRKQYSDDLEKISELSK